MSLSQGDRLGRYEVLAPLGAGGMGEVYRARDTELEREVAVKVLPSSVAQDAERLERFRREARAVARLSHPNILQIHDVGRDGEVSYAVAELLEGDTLRELQGGSAMPWNRARDIAGAVADGLAAAHTRGVIHRDLKPDNIFVTSDGQVKILDFGLARFDSPVASEAETGTLTPPDTLPGAVMGTLGYMSPEQVKGQPADHRSDIFALGCVLYEMLAGRRAFRRDTAVETMTAILKEDPPPLSATGAAVSPEIARTIERCLEKRPERRFQSAADLGFALRAIVSESGLSSAVPRTGVGGSRRWAWLAVAAVLAAAVGLGWWLSRGGGAVRESVLALPFADARRVAVATFENRTGDPSLEALGLMAADLMTDGILTNQVADVVPRSTVRRFEGEIAAGEGTGDPLAALGAAGEAPLVVSGAYYLQGEEIAFQASVTDIVEGRLVYALEPVSGPPDGAEAAVRALRSRILSVVAIHFNPTAHSHLLSKPPLYEAYREFMAGSELWGVDVSRGAEHMRRACELDPDYFSPRIRLAAGYHQLGQYKKAEEIVSDLTARRGELTSFERHWLAALGAMWEGEYAAAVSHLRDVEQMVPDDAIVKYLIGSHELELNRPGAALESFEAIDVEQMLVQWGRNMVVAQIYGARSQALHLLGKYAGELAAARTGLTVFPDTYRLRRPEARALAALGRIDELSELIDDCFTTGLRQGRPEAVAWIAAVELRAHGHVVESRELAERALSTSRDLGNVDRAEDADLQCDLLLVAERYPEALTACERAAEDLDYLELQARIGCLRARVGDRIGALEVSDRLAAIDRPYLRGENNFYRSAIAAHLGDTGDAMALLRRAISEGSGGYSALHSHMLFDPLRGTPEFEELIEPKG